MLIEIDRSQNILGSILFRRIHRPMADFGAVGRGEEARQTLFPSAVQLLDSLTVVDLTNLESQDRPVCQEPYSGSALNEANTPVLLNCNHVVGRACIERWMLGDHVSYPMCHAAIFEWTTLTALADQDQLGVEAAGPRATGAAGNNTGSSTLKAHLPRLKCLPYWHTKSSQRLGPLVRSV